MSKRMLIDELRESNGMTKEEANVAFEQVVGAIQKTVHSHGRVVLPGFGTLSLKRRAERKYKGFDGTMTVKPERMAVVFTETKVD